MKTAREKGTENKRDKKNQSVHHCLSSKFRNHASKNCSYRIKIIKIGNENKRLSHNNRRTLQIVHHNSKEFKKQKQTQTH